MRMVRGISGKFFRALAEANVNIRAIAQGSSERSISAVISQKRVTEAVALPIQLSLIQDSVLMLY